MKLIIHLFPNFQKNRVWTWIPNLRKSLFLEDSMAEVKGILLSLNSIMANMGEVKGIKALQIGGIITRQIEEAIMGEKRGEADQEIREANLLERTITTPAEEGSLRTTVDHRQ